MLIGISRYDDLKTVLIKTNQLNFIICKICWSIITNYWTKYYVFFIIYVIQLLRTIFIILYILIHVIGHSLNYIFLHGPNILENSKN